jgi:hypothetical protein
MVRLGRFFVLGAALCVTVIVWYGFLSCLVPLFDIFNPGCKSMQALVQKTALVDYPQHLDQPEMIIMVDYLESNDTTIG